ncbi:transcriptional regulator NarP [Escherichia coli]|nr:transcriptional regulator NarP [Escherichia coli]
MPEATPFQVMIVDDHPLMRRGVRQLLELDPGFEVVAEAGDGASAIDLANRLDIDVILLDLNMKGMSGLDTLNALRRDGVTAQIIILTVSDASSDVFALIDAGADGYLLKDSDPEVLLEAIRAGAKGSKVFSERVNQYLREREMFGAEEDPFSVLTERELDVLHELAQGLSNKQIASVLNISEQTVKVHIRNLLRKLNVRSRVAATILFLQQRGGTIKIARWHHHRASFYLLSCGDKCCIACAILRSITARRVSLAGKSFNIISHAATASPNRCCSKALNAYMLNTRILLWSVLTNWRSSSPPRRLSLGSDERVQRFSVSERRITVLRIEAICSSVCIGGNTGVTQRHANAAQHNPAFYISRIFLQLSTHPQRQARHLFFVERIGFRIQRPVQ